MASRVADFDSLAASPVPPPAAPPSSAPGAYAVPALPGPTIVGGVQVKPDPETQAHYARLGMQYMLPSLPGCATWAVRANLLAKL